MSSLSKELILACRNENFTRATQLLQRGADPNVRDKWWWWFRECTPLHYGCEYGSIDFVKLLVETYKCDPEVRDNSQRTPLHYACHLNIVQYLIGKQKCNPEVKDNDQQTPLYLAYKNKHMEIVQFLIRHQSFNPDCVINSNQQVLLHCACQDSDFTIVQYLITEQGCNVDLQDKWGDSALHYACKSSDLEVVMYLIIQGKCNPNLTNHKGNTALHIACRNDDYVKVKVLISDGNCSPDLTNDDGDTALHIACRRWGERNIDIVKCLLADGNSNSNSINKNGQTPLELTTEPEKIRELIRHGANPTNVYKTHGKILGTKQPLQPSVKVFVVGNPSAGKSTLTAALKREKSFVEWLFRSQKKVSGVEEKTAGVIPHDFESKKCGYLTLYDFAGQPEYYSSHAALLQNAIQTSPPIFLVVVDLCESDAEMEQTILYWLSFLENQCTSVSDKPHVIIVGSHADVLRARGEDPKLKSSIFDSLQKSHQFNSLHLSECIVLDCQYSESAGVNELRECLKKSCDSLRKLEALSFNSHCFLVYLLDKYRDTTAVTLKLLQLAIDEGISKSTENQPMYFLPTNLLSLANVCNELNDRGHILFLKDPVLIENSWVIIDKAALLSEVTGTIFAPENFKQHCKLASSTGVVPVSSLAETFPQHNLEMLIGFLSYFEFCHEITDEEVLQLASEQHQTVSEQAEYSPIATPNDSYLLFPALISHITPSIRTRDCSGLEVWKPHLRFHHFGWILKCLRSEQFFTSRFVQVLLLRLAFVFAFPHRQDFPALLRKCSLWKNGIYWGNRDRVETLIEVVEQNKAVIVLMRCPELTSEYLQLRSSVIQKVLAAASEFCNKVDTMESLINPSEIIEYPLKLTSQLTLFSLTEIAEAVVNAKPGVVCSTGQTFSLDEQVMFEPYAHLGKGILHQLFSSEYSTTTVTDRFLSQLADCMRKDFIVELFKPSPLLIAQTPPIQVKVQVLQMWRDGCEGTYQCLREKLDQWSVFAERNPLVLAGVSTHTVHSDQFAESDDETQTHPEQLSLNHLEMVQRAVWDARVKWYNLGLELDTSVSTLEVIQEDNHYKVDKCFTAMLKEWLKTNPTWSSLVEALKSPPVDYPQLAEEVFTNYCNINTTSTPDD